MSDEQYHVVLEYLAIAGGYEGTRYRIGYNSKEDFDAVSAEQWIKRKVKVVAHGVTDEESLRLCQEVELWRLVAAAHENSRVDGILDDTLLEMEMQKVAIVSGASIEEYTLASAQYLAKYSDNLLKQVTALSKIIIK